VLLASHSSVRFQESELMMRLFRVLPLLLLAVIALPSPVVVEAKTTIRRSEAMVTIQVPVTFVGPSEFAFDLSANVPSAEYEPVTDTFPSDAMGFWNEGLKGFRYKGCYTFQIDVVASTKVVASPDFAKPQGGGHTVYMGYGDSQPDDAPPSGDPYAGSLAVTWALNWPHDVTAYLMGLKHTVVSVDQAVADELGAIIEKRGSLPKKCIKATRTIDSKLQGHPTAGETSVSTLVVHVAVEDDSSLSGDATVTVQGDGWSWTEGTPKCIYTYTGEVDNLTVSGTLSDDTVDIVIEGAIDYIYEHSCAPTSTISQDYASTLGTVPLVGELDESGHFEEELTIEVSQYMTTVVTTVIEIVVDEEAVA
jgi:hypothetical protein